jgi:H+/Cl- antiporter ClcA
MASLEPLLQGKDGSFTQYWRRRLSRWLDQRPVTESGIIMVTALIVGLGSGLGAVVFRRLIGSVQTLAYGGLLGGIAPFHLLIIPAVGGAIFGPLIYRFAREAKGHGVPEVMEAIALRGGRIRPRVALVKAHGYTVLQAGDVVEVFGLEDELADAKLCLVETSNMKPER